MDQKQTTTKGTVGSAPRAGGRSFGGGRGSDRGPRGRKPADRREKPEFDQKILSVRRVTRVMAGGRRFTFSVAILIGDRKGSVGLGLGKSVDTTLAINKAVSAAKKTMLKLPLTKDMSFGHEIVGKFKASRIALMPNRGKGLVAGGALRDILLLAGVKNVTGKIHSPSKNHLNNAKAAMLALRSLKMKKSKEVATKSE